MLTRDIPGRRVTPPKPRKVPTKAAAIAAAAKRMPNATPTEIAAKVGTTERTARRHLQALNRQDVLAVSDGTVPTSHSEISLTTRGRQRSRVLAEVTS